MNNAIMIDTNVMITANDKADHVGLECIDACQKKLVEIQKAGRVVLDSTWFIMNEYMRNVNMSGQPGLGDFFLKWLWDNQGNVTACTLVDVPVEDSDGYEFSNFPDDPDLSKFDRSDRKFVATALASGENPPIVNATDSDWLHYVQALGRHGIRVEFLCLEII